MSDAPIATILMTAYNRSHLLEWGLYSLSKQKCKYPFDIIVLNDGLPDNTEAVCDAFKDLLNIKYIFTGQRNVNTDEPWWRIPGFSLNIGVKNTNADIIFLSCAEIYHVEDFILERCIDRLLQNSELMVTPTGKDDSGCFLKKLTDGEEITRLDVDRDRSSSALNVLQPFFMGMMRKHYIKLGGYDEDLIGIGYDDDDIMYRFRTYGLRDARIDGRIVHLWHKRVWNPRNPRQSENRRIYRSKRQPNNIIRNKDREWGI